MKRRKRKSRRAHRKLVLYEHLLVRNFNPEEEAKSFYGMFLRRSPVEKLRADIDVSDRVVKFWKSLETSGDWDAWIGIHRILPLRKKTLALFNHLVENHGQENFA